MGSQVGTKDCVGWTVLHHAVHSQNVRAIEAAIGTLPALPACTVQRAQQDFAQPGCQAVLRRQRLNNCAHRL